LLVIKARLFNIFRSKGPEAYNRVVDKIQAVLAKFKPTLSERQNSGDAHSQQQGKQCSATAEAVQK